MEEKKNEFARQLDKNQARLNQKKTKAYPISSSTSSESDDDESVYESSLLSVGRMYRFCIGRFELNMLTRLCLDLHKSG